MIIDQLLTFLMPLPNSERPTTSLTLRLEEGPYGWVHATLIRCDADPLEELKDRQRPYVRES